MIEVEPLIFSMSTENVTITPLFANLQWAVINEFFQFGRKSNGRGQWNKEYLLRLKIFTLLHIVI